MRRWRGDCAGQRRWSFGSVCGSRCCRQMGGMEIRRTGECNRRGDRGGKGSDGRPRKRRCRDVRAGRRRGGKVHAEPLGQPPRTSPWISMRQAGFERPAAGQAVGKLVGPLGHRGSHRGHGVRQRCDGCTQRRGMPVGAVEQWGRGGVRGGRQPPEGRRRVRQNGRSVPCGGCCQASRHRPDRRGNALGQGRRVARRLGPARSAVQNGQQLLVVRGDIAAGHRHGPRDEQLRGTGGGAARRTKPAQGLGERAEFLGDPQLGLAHRPGVRGEALGQHAALGAGGGRVRAFVAEDAIRRRPKPAGQATATHGQHLLGVPVGVRGGGGELGCRVVVGGRRGAERVLVNLRPVALQSQRGRLADLRRKSQTHRYALPSAAPRTRAEPC